MFSTLAALVLAAGVFLYASQVALAAGTVSGSVFFDTDGDGVDDGAGDPAARDVGVRIWDDADVSGTINGGDIIVAGDMTDAGGDYAFPSLPDGNYLVQAFDPTGILGVGAFTTAHPLDATIAGAAVTGQSIGFMQNAMDGDGTLDSTVKIDDTTVNGPALADGDEYGRGVADIGDLNLDGVRDLAVGAHSDNTGGANRGAVYIHFMNADGSVDSTAKIDDTTVNGPTLANGDEYGWSVAGIGDLNGDGVQDIAVGAYLDDTGSINAGAVYIHFMNIDGSINSTAKIDFTTPNGPGLVSSGDEFGWDIANLGDLNLDGVQDLAVAASGDDVFAGNAGAIHIHFMNTDGSIDTTVKIDGTTPNGPSLAASDFYGTSVANIGDLDGDGVQDLAVGADLDDAGGSNRGAVHIHFMNTDGSVDSTIEINSTTVNGPALADNDEYGWGVTAIGDLDGDGVQDLAVGATYDNAGGTDRGGAHLHLMNTDGSVAATFKIDTATVNGPTLADDDRFGSSITAIGDLDRNGVQDLAVGAVGDETGGGNRGAVHIVYLHTTSNVLVEYSSATAASTEESVADNFPRLLVNGTLATDESIDVNMTGGGHLHRHARDVGRDPASDARRRQYRRERRRHHVRVLGLDRPSQ